MALRHNGILVNGEGKHTVWSGSVMAKASLDL